MRPFRYILCALLVAVSCGRPASEEFFVKTSGRDEEGRYRFRMDFTDSTLVYDVDLMVSMECDDAHFIRFRQMPMRVRWTSPSGRPYEDSLWISRRNLSDSTFYVKNFWLPYRRDICPVEAGEWDLAVTLSEEITKQFDIIGTGVRLARKKERTPWDTEN